jgi:branched-chain amino acid transport system ATP-binding protein
LHEIRSGYGQVAALQGVDVSIAEGECVVLLGANGAGKTTVLRTISGVVRPTSGNVQFRGANITGRKPHQIARLGIAHIPEGRGIFPGLTVRENLRLGTFGMSDAIRHETDSVERVCTLFPALRPKLADTGASLSGGQQQMLAIGRGLMSRPAMLLLDEPSLGLAPVLVDQVFAALRQIKDEGTTLLLVEQSARHALALADHGYVLNRGQVVQRGTAAELGANLHQAYLS